ncbi:MAG: hypothetical protein ACI9TI_002543, partial [Natronomonas sp.]
YGFPSGVTTSSRFANAVTLVVTAVELVVAAGIVHVLPAYVDLGWASRLPIPV